LSVVPPVATPLTISFAAGDAARVADGDLDAAVWALRRWDIASVRVVGHAASNNDSSNSRALALARARTVAALLAERGLAVSIASDPTGPAQRRAEAEQGLAAFRRVDIEPVAPPLSP
jgi:outer membrane protein OmpA-like peptidoglycan-associated protein